MSSLRWEFFIRHPLPAVWIHLRRRGGADASTAVLKAAAGEDKRSLNYAEIPKDTKSQTRHCLAGGFAHWMIAYKLVQDVNMFLDDGMKDTDLLTFWVGHEGSDFQNN